jgi:hypothetical protein
MRIRQIAVVHVPFARLSDALAPATASVASIAEGWSAFTGKSGGLVGLRASVDATLAMPLAPFEVGEDLAVHLRELLGDALDGHTDERGVFVLEDGPIPEAASYDALVAAPGAWIPRVGADDPRLQKSAGWSFEAAARELGASPGTAERVAAQAEDNPLASAGAKFGEVFARREERGSLRRSLSAALNSAIEDSALAPDESDKPGAEDLGHLDAPLADVLVRQAGSNPRKATAMEGLLRDAVERDLPKEASDAAADEPALDKPAPDADDGAPSAD